MRIDALRFRADAPRKKNKRISTHLFTLLLFVVGVCCIKHHGVPRSKIRCVASPPFPLLPSGFCGCVSHFFYCILHHHFISPMALPIIIKMKSAIDLCNKIALITIKILDHTPGHPKSDEKQRAIFSPYVLCNSQFNYDYCLSCPCCWNWISHFHHLS